MQRLELTLPTPAENLALDEALLDWAEHEDGDAEYLRLWESPQPMVVIGRSTRVAQEVDVAECRACGIPVLRRSSGGAAIVAGPGCLMYAVVLSTRLRPELRDIGRAHLFVLEQITKALGEIGFAAERAGTSDLACEGRKFSGNSLRVKRTHLLYHGTLLYDFDLTLIEKCLRMPPRVPEYRAKRSHEEFVMNLQASRGQLVAALDAAWPTAGALVDWPRDVVAQLVRDRFARDEWTFEFA